jgi:hypothetical protein
MCALGLEGAVVPRRKRRLVTRQVTAVILLLAFSACGQSRASDQSASQSTSAGPPGADGTQQKSDRGDALRGLRECATEPPPLAGADWQRVEAAPIALRLPPSCAADRDAPRFVHGGFSWRCAAFGVEATRGMWGLQSFGNDETQCRTSIAGVPALISERSEAGRSRLLAWYLTGTVHEPLISAWGIAPADMPAARAVVYSGRLLPRSGS